VLTERYKSLLKDDHRREEKMSMVVKTPGFHMGSPAAAEEEGEEVAGGRWEVRAHTNSSMVRNRLRVLLTKSTGIALCVRFDTFLSISYSR